MTTPTLKLRLAWGRALTQPLVQAVTHVTLREQNLAIDALANERVQAQWHRSFLPAPRAQELVHQFELRKGSKRCLATLAELTRLEVAWDLDVAASAPEEVKE